MTKLKSPNILSLEYFDQRRKDGKMFVFQTIYAPQGLVITFFTSLFPF